jgi:hypothetical protein
MACHGALAMVRVRLAAVPVLLVASAAASVMMSSDSTA